MGLLAAYFLRLRDRTADRRRTLQPGRRGPVPPWLGGVSSASGAAQNSAQPGLARFVTCSFSVPRPRSGPDGSGERRHAVRLAQVRGAQHRLGSSRRSGRAAAAARLGRLLICAVVSLPPTPGRGPWQLPGFRGVPVLEASRDGRSSPRSACRSRWCTGAFPDQRLVASCPTLTAGGLLSVPGPRCRIVRTVRTMFLGHDMPSQRPLLAPDTPGVPGPRRLHRVDRIPRVPSRDHRPPTAPGPVSIPTATCPAILLLSVSPSSADHRVQPGDYPPLHLVRPSALRQPPAALRPSSTFVDCSSAQVIPNEQPHVLPPSKSDTASKPVGENYQRLITVLKPNQGRARHPSRSLSRPPAGARSFGRTHCPVDRVLTPPALTRPSLPMPDSLTLIRRPGYVLLRGRAYSYATALVSVCRHRR